MLIGSINSLTPWFSTQVSPSCSVSSNSKPYCMPEQPPPWMNTRSLRFGLPSPRIRSPTLRAAASVNVSVSVSVMCCTLPAGFDGRNRRGRLGGRLGACGHRAARQRDQFARYDGTRSHFNDPVVHIPVDARLAAEHQAFARTHVSVDGAIHDDVGHFDAAFDEATLAHRQRTTIGGRAADIAVDAAIEVQAARGFEIGIEQGGLAQQGID